MTTTELTTADALLNAARTLTPTIRQHADAAEEQRRLPDDVVRALQDAGFYRMWLPRQLGGSEVDPLTTLRVIEALAYADGSVGWCVFAHAANLFFVAPRLDLADGRQVFADPDVILVEANQPRGRAYPVDGGYRVSGRWPFGSGASHARWFAGTCLMMDGDQPRQLPNGLPETRLLLFPATDCTVIDTWQTTGLRATASHDWQVQEVFVPDAYAAQPAVDVAVFPGPLYRAGIYLSCGAAIALGVAQHALDGFRELATEKTPFTMSQRLCEQPRVQAQMARAEALVGSARSFLVDRSRAVWEALRRGEVPTAAERAPVALASLLAQSNAIEAVEILYRLGGGSSVYATSPLDRCLRDLHTLGGHVGFGPGLHEAAGRGYLGLDPGVPYW